MPECGNCGGHVTKDYERVKKPDGYEQVRCCPNCELTRDGNDVREMRGYSE